MGIGITVLARSACAGLAWRCLAGKRCGARRCYGSLWFFFFQAEDGIRDWSVTGVQTCALPIWLLTLFGGGDQGCFNAAESIFRVIARKYFYLGPSGSGATMKLVVNTLLGIGMQAIAEAVALGAKAGLDRKSVV